VFDSPDLAHVHDLASSIPDLRVGASAASLALLIPFLNTLLEFRESR
jgi:hypothetical protein